MLRDLLVHVDGSLAGRRRVRFAMDLAGRMGARLIGLHVTPPVEVPPRYKPSRIEQVAAEIALQLASDARTAAEVFGEETAQRGTDACWLEAAGDMVAGIGENARYADLVIVGQSEWQGPPEAHPLPVAHSVVLRCGRPVLVMPTLLESCALGKIVVAWDGSREAVRAVHDALPLLHLSRLVQVVTMTHPSADDNEVDAEKLLAHLTRHEIKVAASVRSVKAVEEHKSLQQEIEQGHYDLLVMGAYSHPIWLEFIFGGATQSILMSSTVPVLVSH